MARREHRRALARAAPGLLLGALLGAVAAHAERIDPDTMTPLIGPGYVAQDADERGLWQSSDKIEQQIANSNLVVRDEQLNAYVGGVIERLLGDTADDIRLYIVRNPEFNASMFPNGMMIVHTGLLARMRNEAQLAAVLGHEAGHYLRRHTLDRWRSIRTKTAIMSVLSLGGAAATGASGGTTNWYDVANAINSGLLLSIFSYSREHEEEADAFGLRLLAQSQYSPYAAAEIWSQVLEERRRSAEARDKKYKDHSRSILSTHPPTEDRMTDLQASAKDLVEKLGPNASLHDGREEWRAGTAAIHMSLLDEQVKLNDPGASLYLVESLGQAEWTSALHFFLGEIYALRGAEGDETRAAEAYAQAAAHPEPVPEALRAHGYAQLKLGNRDEARQALERYLALRPDAVDAAMIRFTIGQ